MRLRLFCGAAVLVGVFASGCAQRQVTESGPRRGVVELPGGGSPVFSAGIRTGNLLFLSGVVGRSETGDISEATRNALDGIQDRLEAAGMSMTDVVQCTVFMTDIGQYQEINETYVQYFDSEPPARTAIAVEAVPANGQMEIACIAAVP